MTGRRFLRCHQHKRNLGRCHLLLTLPSMSHQTSRRTTTFVRPILPIRTDSDVLTIHVGVHPRERNETIGTEKLGTKHMVDNRCTAVVEGIGIGIDRSRCHCRFCKVPFFSPIPSNPIKRDCRCLPSLPANTHRSTMDGGTQTRRHRHSGRKGIVFPVQESVRVCCC